MTSNIIVPLETFGIGILISYGIAILIKVMLGCIQHFPSKTKCK